MQFGNSNTFVGFSDGDSVSSDDPENLRLELDFIPCYPPFVSRRILGDVRVLRKYFHGRSI